ncbi:MAG: hypothetical protein IJX12_00745, partial [Lachnospiraceae bacterium]|nr:hypothetical protein [Lachnospiraceae bacterium]
MIMPISTSGIGNMDIGQSQGSKAKNKAEEAAADAFASLMNMTSKNVDDNPFVLGEDSNIETAKTEENYAGKEEYSYENKYEPSKVEKTEEKGDSDFSSKTPDKAVDATTSKYGEVQKEEVVEVAASVLIELKEMVMEELNITPEELDSLLQDMNLSLEDLLDVGNMKEFILQFKDSTNVDLLIDENLADLVKDVTAKLNELMSEHKITNVDDFINLVKDFETEITEAIEVKESPIPEETIPQNDVKIVTDNVEDVEDVPEEGQDKLTTTKTAENVMNSEENVDLTISDTSK